MGANGSGESRSAYGLLVSALGAVLLAVSVFLPWYGVSFTARGVAMAQQASEQAGQQFGNAALQGYLGQLHSALGALVGREVASVSAHQALSTLNVVLLILAGLSVLIALLALAGPASAASDANRGPLALLGLIAAACVLFRIIDPPTPDAGLGLVSLSLREGVWLALLGCICIAGGALWHGSMRSERSGVGASAGAGAAVSADDGANVWSELSGWTPET
jgi:hypothetical protein